MTIKFGKPVDMSAEMLVLKQPLYVSRLVGNQAAVSKPGSVRCEIMRLISIFDDKPYSGTCRGDDCGRPATRASIYYRGKADLMCWCDTCNPYEQGASHGRLHIVRTYFDVISYMRGNSLRKKRDTNRLILAMAKAKGLAERVTQSAAIAFFSE